MNVRDAVNRRSRPGQPRRSGSVLVEFALISFALYFLMAAMLEIGRAIFAAQVIQTAADVMARELAVAPLPATANFQEALNHPYVRSRIYDEAALVISLDNIPPGPALDAHFSTLPIVNQILRPVMINEQVGGQLLMRYPGALVHNTLDDSLTVLVPRVVERQASGVETIEWVRVVEEVLPEPQSPEDPPPQSHFGIDAPLRPFRGLASVRFHYPYQAAALSAWQRTGAPPGQPQQTPVLASDDDVSDLGLPAGYSLAGTDLPTGSPYAGRYGLGRHYILVGDAVRPWRKLLSAQAVRRREVFQ